MASIATNPRIRPRGVQQNYQPVIPALEEGDLDEKLLVRLAFDALTCVDRRISQDQRLLKEKLGPLGDEFDSVLHSVTDKLLLQYPWNDADDFKDILFKLLVADGEICSERFFRRWEASKATDNGKAGLDRWRHYFSARKSQLLFQRRQYIINRPPSVLFGCLSAVDRGEASAGKSLVSREFLLANVGAKEVYAQRFSFGIPDAYTGLDKPYACYGRISHGIFFGMAGYYEGNSKIFEVQPSHPYPSGYDGWIKADPVLYSNPFTEMLKICELFEDRVKTVMIELERIKFFEVVQLSPLTQKLVDPKCPEVQELSYFEIVSLTNAVYKDALGLYRQREDDESLAWAQLEDTDEDSFKQLVKDLALATDSFKTNVWYSDLHFFFAYFRGKLSVVVHFYKIVNCFSLCNIERF